MRMRKAAFDRTTKETSIRIRLTIEGRGRYKVSTGIRFFDHMLELFAHHGGFDLELTANGDLDVDQHHTVEDVGIALGQAFSQALGNKRGILRAGYFVMPMDETLGLAAVDFSGRAAAIVDTKVRVRLVGDLQSELSMAARIITRLKRCSKRLRGHCAPPAGTINKWRACFPAPKDYCDRNRRLSCRQSDFGKEGV